MAKLKIMNRITTIIISVSLIGGLVLMLTGYMLGAKTSAYADFTGLHIANCDIQTVSEYNLQPFQDIRIDGTAIDIEVIPSDFYGVDIVNHSSAKVDWQIDDGKLLISQKSISLSRWFIIESAFFDTGVTTESYVKVYLPKAAALNSLVIQTASGDITLRDFTGKTAQIGTASGDITLHNFTGETAQIGTASGDITLVQNTISNATLNATSGTITVSSCSLKNGQIHVVSGDVSAKELVSDGLSIDSTSGDIWLQGNFTGNTHIRSISGDIKIATTHKAEDYDKNLSAKSGEINIDGQKTKQYQDLPNNKAPYRLTITGMSSDINVSFSKDSPLDTINIQ